MPKMKLSYLDRLDQLQFVMKTRQDIDMIDRIGMIFVENDTELSWLYEPGVVYDEN